MNSTDAPKITAVNPQPSSGANPLLVKHHTSSHAQRPKPALGRYSRIELALEGASSAQAMRLLNLLSEHFRVAWVTAGTAEANSRLPAVQGGAAMVMADDAHQHTLHHAQPLDSYHAPFLLSEADFVLMERRYSDAVPVIHFRDRIVPHAVATDAADTDAASTHAVAVFGRAAGTSALPVFKKLEDLALFIHEWATAKALLTPLHGLVLAGGESLRMGRDKGSLVYHNGESERVRCARLLSEVCADVFVSCRAEQITSLEPELNPLTDAFLGIGAMGGILSALMRRPNAAWLVAACDMPYLDGATVQHLVRHRNPFKLATAYRNPTTHLPEPLAAIWEPKSLQTLLRFLAQGTDCPRKVLIHSDAHLLAPPQPDALSNVNTPDDYERAISEFFRQGNASRSNEHES